VKIFSQTEQTTSPTGDDSPPFDLESAATVGSVFTLAAGFSGGKKGR
jgi:hypothetical protein